MDSRYVIIAFIILMLVPLVSSQETFERGKDLDIRHTVADDGNISAINSVNITVRLPNNSVLVPFGQMTFDSTTQEWNYTLNSSQVQILGTYSYIIFASADDGDTKQAGFTFEVTPTGENLSTSQGILYIGVIGASGAFFFFCLFWAVKIPFRHQRDSNGFIVEKSDLRYVKLFLWFVCYLLLIFIFFMAEHTSDSYLRLDIASNFFNGIFWFLVSFLLPVFVVMVLVGFGAYFKDLEIFKAMERGVNPR